jgi:anti-sigma regulatory factor (Ser/Thr protein kinase)
LTTLRRLFREQLRAWGVGDADIQDATVVANELASNAIGHAATPFELSIDLCDQTLSIAVVDLLPDCPRSRRPDHTGGRGLALITALTRGWRCFPIASGKIVTAELVLS